MDRIINRIMRVFRKKYFLVVFVFVCIIGLLGSTYSYWSSESGWKLASEIKFRELNYLMTINDQSVDTITSTAGSGTTFYDIKITSLNDLNTRYSLTYDSNVEGVEVKLSSLSVNDSNGIIGLYESVINTEKNKVIRIAVINQTQSNATITLEVVGGYTWNPENQTKITNGFSRITQIIDESSKSIANTLSQELNTMMDCTPTATSPCLLEENSANYLTYSGHTWRIIGTYLINDELTTKLILNDVVDVTSTHDNSSLALESFYTTLDSTLIRTASPFECTVTNDEMTCTGSANIGSLSRAEYERLGGVNSYLYTKPNKNYWLNDRFYVGTSRGFENKNSSTLAYIRPSIYLKSNTVVATLGSYESTTLNNLVYNSGFTQGTGGSDGWVGENNASILVSDITVNDEDMLIATINPTTLRTYIEQSPAVAITGGHKFYTRAIVSSITISELSYEVLGTTQSVIINPARSTPVVSDIITAPSNATTASILIRSVRTGAFGRFGLAQPLLIDLTEAFGEGNEPTLEWCDENIPYFSTTTSMAKYLRELGKIDNPYTISEGIFVTVNNGTGNTNLVSGYYAKNTTYPIASKTPPDMYHYLESWTATGTGTTGNSNSITIGSTNSTLTANWERIPVNVTFNANTGDTWTGSTCTGTGITLEDGQCSKIALAGAPYGTLPDPLKESYTFVNWRSEANGGTLVNALTDVNTIDAHSIYANWVIGNRITFDLNGGDPWTYLTCTGTGLTLGFGTCTKLVLTDGTYGTMPTPTKSGVEFIGWYTAPTGGTLVTSSTIATTVRAQTLYARYPKPLQELILEETAYADNVNSPYVQNGTPGIDYSANSSTTNGQGLYYTSTNTESTCEVGDPTYVSSGVCRTYFYRGAVENNYVSFANELWRIVRINEDGSIKLITQNPVSDRTTPTARTTSAFSSSWTGVTYSDSIIKDFLDNPTIGWYGKISDYASYLIDTRICNDMSIVSTSKYTYYGASERIDSGTPEFACPASSVTNAPAGLLSADEALYAGIKSYQSVSSYLAIGSTWWTSSPYRICIGLCDWDDVIIVYSSGGISYEAVFYTLGVRPVVSLKADAVVLWGVGTSDDPYVITE